MDRQLAERMVGAACLLAVLVLVVPAILDGNPDSGATITHPAVEESLDLRTHTIRLDGAEREPPVPTPVQPGGPVDEPLPEPPLPEPRPPPTAPELARTLPTVPEAPPAEPPVVVSPEPVAEPPKVPARTPVPAGDWIVQLGSFSNRGNAERLAAEVRRQGFPVAVQGGGGSNGGLFRVRAGPEPDRAAAEALERRLAAVGFAGGRVGRQ